MLANQIAAGEVIERPASVVKELVENAIDAHSTQIDIRIEEAGLRKIEVIDNGDGIPASEVEKAFKRHATSKIHSRDDLFRIRTLGFRGEALPSIASVSEVTLETSTGDEKGTYLYLKGGKVLEQRSSDARKGSKIAIENLFFNTPARLKYVKTLQTELANIGDIINRLAMSHPTIAFRLVHDGNQMLRTVGNGDLRQTLAGVYGVQTAKKMRPIKNENLDFTISGYVSLPEVTRASRNYLSIIINGRYIKNYLLNKAIVEGYGSKLMVGRFPIAAIEIKMDPLLVDVNVHPTKQEVRISNEKELMKLLTEAIQEALGKEQLIPDALENLGFKNKFKKTMDKSEQIQIEFEKEKAEQLRNEYEEPNTHDQSPHSDTEIVSASQEDNEVHHNTNEDRFYYAEEKNSQESIDKSNFSQIEEKVPSFKTLEAQSDLAELHQGSHVKAADKMMAEENENKQLPRLEYIGQMHGTYLFAQNEKGLYILDQHAAQERIKYEYFRKKIGEVSSDLQELLVPIMLDYPNSDVIKIQESQEALAKVGINLEPFGQNSFLLRRHPVWFTAGEEEKIVRELIDLLLENGSISIAKFREATAIMMSCKQSIKANHYLNAHEARQLLIDLAETENPYNCPHGRPVLIKFSNKDMEKMFKRIQDPH